MRALLVEMQLSTTFTMTTLTSQTRICDGDWHYLKWTRYRLDGSKLQLSFARSDESGRTNLVNSHCRAVAVAGIG